MSKRVYPLTGQDTYIMRDCMNRIDGELSKREPNMQILKDSIQVLFEEVDVVCDYTDHRNLTNATCNMCKEQSQDNIEGFVYNNYWFCKYCFDTDTENTIKTKPDITR